jgi:ubiquinone biosynthesis protein UbiJ
MLQGERPRVEVAGDAALAANVNWLFDNLRWEPHDDLARLFGAAPATELERAARMAGGAARRAAVWAFGLVPRGASSSGARGRRTG